ncbi:MAG: hypothetical protein SPH07_02485 [Eubacteriales bacterium]|nr:hypothetical protein [Eubacteriales bacterium]
MKIEIYSKQGLCEKALLPFAPRTSLISIGNTDEELPELKNKPQNMLRVNFDDITLTEVKNEYLLPSDYPDDKIVAKLKQHGINFIDDETAKKIADFIVTHVHETDTLICQCFYGQSRSAGCAAAITQYYYGNGIDIFADDRYYPNKLVYRKVLVALNN